MPKANNAKAKSKGIKPCAEKSKDQMISVPTKLPSVSKWGHILKNYEERSVDVTLQEDVTFEKMHIKDKVLQGLHSAGFTKPSPVQYKAIPLGKFGVDLIVQAKSGTGKTCVFTVLALEMVVASATTTQVLILAPTREIAAQITSVIKCIGLHIQGLEVHTFFGGTKVEVPKVCHIAVGTPGRVLHLLSSGKMSGDNIRLLVLDEADQLLDHFKQDVQQILTALPHSKQVVCTSATYTTPLEKLAEKMMRSKVHVTLGSEQLLGVTQFIYKLPTNHKSMAFNGKLLPVKAILRSTSFSQCIIFTSSVLNAESIASNLKRSGMPVALLCGGQPQEKRLQALDDLVSFRCRILVATDLAARGLDSAHVSLVISMDPPPSPFTYLHRVGRAGRFGAEGKSVILATEGDDWLHVQAIVTKLNIKIYELPDVNMLATSTDHMTVLPHLSLNQFEEWKKNTSHKLSYSDSEDQFDVWKLDAKISSGETSVVEKVQNGISEPSDEIVTNAVTDHDVQVNSLSNGNGISGHLPISVEKEAYDSPEGNSNGQTDDNKVHPNVSDSSATVNYSYELNEKCAALKTKLKSALKFDDEIVNDNADCLNVSERDLNPSEEATLLEYLRAKDEMRKGEVIQTEKLPQETKSNSESSVQTSNTEGNHSKDIKDKPSIIQEKEEKNDSYSFHLKTLKTEKNMTSRKNVNYKSGEAAANGKARPDFYQTSDYNQIETHDQHFNYQNGYYTRENPPNKTSSAKKKVNGFSNHLKPQNILAPHPNSSYHTPYQTYQNPYPPTYQTPYLYQIPHAHQTPYPYQITYPQQTPYPYQTPYPPYPYQTPYPPYPYQIPYPTYQTPYQIPYPYQIPHTYCNQSPLMHSQYPSVVNKPTSNVKMQSYHHRQTMDSYAGNMRLTSSMTSKQQNEIFEKTRKDTMKALRRIENGYTSSKSASLDDEKDSETEEEEESETEAEESETEEEEESETEEEEESETSGSETS